MSTLAALTAREWRRTLRQPARVAVTIATPLLVWLFLASGFARSIRPGVSGSADGMDYTAYLLPGMLALLVLFSSIFGAISLIEDRASGFLQSVLVSPAPRWTVACSKLLGAGTLAAAQAAVLLLAVPMTGLAPGIAGWTGALLGIVLLAAGTAGFSLALAWRIDSVSGFHGVMNLLLMPAWLLSGAVFPLAGASPWLEAVSLANPVTWSIELIRSSLGGSWTDRPESSPAVLWGLAAGFAVAGSLAAMATISRGPSRRA